jgi:hypothetical protein
LLGEKLSAEELMKKSPQLQKEETKSMLKDFKAQYLNSSTADIKLVFGDEVLPAHKFVLAARYQIHESHFG